MNIADLIASVAVTIAAQSHGAYYPAPPGAPPWRVRQFYEQQQQGGGGYPPYSPPPMARAPMPAPPAPQPQQQVHPQLSQDQWREAIVQEAQRFCEAYPTDRQCHFKTSPAR